MLYIFSIRYFDSNIQIEDVISDIPNNIPIYAPLLKVSVSADSDSFDIASPDKIMLGIINGIINIERKLVLERKYPSIADIRHIRAELEAHNITPEKSITTIRLVLTSNMK